MCTRYKHSASWGIPLLAGTCSQFCPPEESERRKALRRLHVLEVSPSSEEEASGNESVPVKEFIRSGAGHVTPVPSDLRPLNVLVDAITYLITKVCERSDYPWWLVCEFVTNRLQSIRQDITYQQLTGSDVDYIYQLAARFYLYAQYRLWRCPVDKFDPKLNRDHLQQCLVKLVRQGIVSYPKFEAYHLLVNLGNPHSVQHALQLSNDLRSQPCVARAICISRSYMENNYIRWFRLVATLSPLEQSAVLPYVSTMRRVALSIVSKAYCSRNGGIPIATLSTWLLMPDIASTSELCTTYGLAVWGETISIKRGAFTLPAKAPEDGLEIAHKLSPSHLMLPSPTF